MCESCPLLSLSHPVQLKIRAKPNVSSCKSVRAYSPFPNNRNSSAHTCNSGKSSTHSCQCRSNATPTDPSGYINILAPPSSLPPRSTIDGTIHHPSDPASRSSGYDVPTVLAAIRVSELHHWAAPPIARVNNFSSQPAGQVTRAWNLGFGFGLEFGVGHHRKTQDAEPTPTTGRFDGGPGASSRRADGRTRIAMFHTLRQHAVIHRSRRAGLYRGRVHRLLGRLSLPELHQLRVDKPLRVGGRNRYPVHAL